MRRKKIIEASVVCILLLLLGAYMEFSSRSMDDKNRIIRGSPGSGRQEVELTLNAGEQLKDYDYQISVPAQCIDEKTAQSYFSRAEKEIDETFFPEGEEAAHVTEQVHMKPSYVKGLVKADWTLDQYNAVSIINCFNTVSGQKTQTRPQTRQMIANTRSMPHFSYPYFLAFTASVTARIP